MKLFTTLAFALALPALHSFGATLVYDGFASGGSTPNAYQYQTAGSYPGNFLSFYDPTLSPNSIQGGQNPSVLGFKNAWTSPNNSVGQTASAVGFRAVSNSLSYTDSRGNAMNTTAGAASLARTAGNTTEKTIFRAMDLVAAPSTVYISTLINFTAGQSIEFDFQTLGASIKPFFGFGVDSSGTAYVQTSLNTNYLTSSQKVSATSALSANTTHLLVLKVEQSPNSALQDTISLYVNPNLDEALSNPVATYTGDFYVANNNDFYWGNMAITGTPTNGGTFLFDELRLTDTWIGAVPEPSHAALLMTATLGFVFRRNRTQSA